MTIETEVEGGRFLLTETERDGVWLSERVLGTDRWLLLAQFNTKGEAETAALNRATGQTILPPQQPRPVLCRRPSLPVEMEPSTRTIRPRKSWSTLSKRECLRRAKMAQKTRAEKNEARRLRSLDRAAAIGALIQKFGGVVGRKPKPSPKVRVRFEVWTPQMTEAETSASYGVTFG